MEHRAISAVPLTAMVFLASFSTVWATESFTSSPISTEISVDGDDADWNGLQLTYIEESVRVVGITHDADTLYLMWRFADERLAHLISRRGVTVWVNGDNKKKKAYGLRYAGSEEMVTALDEAAAERWSEAQPDDAERGYGGGMVGGGRGGMGGAGMEGDRGNMKKMLAGETVWIKVKLQPIAPPSR